MFLNLICLITIHRLCYLRNHYLDKKLSCIVNHVANHDVNYVVNHVIDYVANHIIDYV